MNKIGTKAKGQGQSEAVAKRILDPKPLTLDANVGQRAKEQGPSVVAAEKVLDPRSSTLDPRKAVFFDRDGTLNVEVGYLCDFEKFKWIEGATEAIKFCNDNGYLAIVVTNQSGVARGYYTEADVKELHRRMNEELNKHGANIDDFFYCPHHPEGVVAKYSIDCECRKPKSGLIEEACKKYDIDKSKSLMIGDMPRDVECGENAGVRGVLFNGDNLLNVLKDALTQF